MKSKISILNILLVFFIWGCDDDFLDRPPVDSITIDNFYKTPEQINAATAALYGMPWFALNDKAHWTIGDSRAGNDWTSDGSMAQFFTFSVTSANPHLNEAWNSLWMVIAHSNSVINEIPSRADASIPAQIIQRAVGEGRFMRATAYFYLVRLWGAVPIIENNTPLVFQPKVPKNRIEDVYTFIIRDLEKAIEVLPESSANNPGRVTSWAARAMLAKVHLTFSGYNQNGTRNQQHLDKARDLALDVYKNSGLTLMSNYADLFKLEYENNSESLFAFQWTSCLSWATQNTNQAYWAYSSGITKANDGWGGYKGPTIDLQREFDNPGDQRRPVTYMRHGDFYPEIARAEGGYRHNIPQEEAAPVNAHVKKYIIGSAADNGTGTVCFMSTGLNTYVLRLADVYLVLAEAILGNNASTSDGEAIGAFNAVRNRAGLPSVSSITWEDIRKERRLEFAYEAQYWYDLVAWYYYNPQAALDHIRNQERGTYTWDATAKEIKLNSVKYNVTDEAFFLPIPSRDSDINPLLLEDPVPYDFKD
jgi:starch-binding outer membrane protein, SusD/RagB family